MPIPLIDRLLFAQGGLCFFCDAPLPKEEATVEHLDAKANGGTNSDKNCVACCSEINSLLGSMSLKEKIRVILNQNGKFACPKAMLTSTKLNPTASATASSQYSILLANLERRGTSRPKGVEALKNTIRGILTSAKGTLSEPQLDFLLEQLQHNGIVQISGTKVSYSFKQSKPTTVSATNCPSLS